MPHKPYPKGIVFKGTSFQSVTTGTGQKATIHQVTTMLATSKNVLFPGHDRLLTTSADDPTLNIRPSASEWRVISTGG